MGVALLPAGRRARRSAVPLAGKVPAALAAILSAAAAVSALAFVAVLISMGWQQLPAVFSSSAPQGAGAAILTSAALVALVLPTTLIIAVPAAACVWDVHIGGAAARTLRSWLVISASAPAVVAGAAVFLACMMLGVRVGFWTAFLGMVALNVPQASARIIRVLQRMPKATIYATAAAGAAPAFAFLSVALRTMARPLIALALTLCAQLLGQTAVIVLAAGLNGPRPLAVQIWQFAPDLRLTGYTAAQALVLTVACGVLVAVSESVTGYWSQRGRSATGAGI